LSPTALGDFEGLAATVDEKTFQHFLGGPNFSSAEAFAPFLNQATSSAYTMRLRETGEIVGSSSFMDQREPHRAVEIGCTWIAPKWRGTYVNPEAKLLMLQHGFEGLDCVRVQLKCDARNDRSSNAIAKLGAQFEGRLRNYGILPDGYIRDTLMYSVLDKEWPEVRARLESRLLGLT
jgi:RimJ/RimL family protein N-acetyltransferase